MQDKGANFVIWPAVIAIIAMLLALLSWPYGAYTLLKGVTAVVAAYYAYDVYTRTEAFGLWFWIMVIIALFLNPIIPVHLGDQGLWQAVDIITAILFVVFIPTQRRH